MSWILLAILLIGGTIVAGGFAFMMFYMIQMRNSDRAQIQEHRKEMDQQREESEQQRKDMDEMHLFMTESRSLIRNLEKRSRLSEGEGTGD